VGGSRAVFRGSSDDREQDEKGHDRDAEGQPRRSAPCLRRRAGVARARERLHRQYSTRRFMRGQELRGGSHAGPAVKVSRPSTDRYHRTQVGHAPKRLGFRSSWFR
jgi:hypothetical protein